MTFSVITSTYNQLDKLKRLRKDLNNQKFYDFEWIIADDGSSDSTDKWAEKNADEYVWQNDWGYRLTKILNKAAKLATGDFLVWIMADSTPKSNFLEILHNRMTPNTLATGIRINLKDDKYHSHDWRVATMKDKLNEDELIIQGNNPWGWMTLNGMCMPRKKYNQMGGIYEEYDEGYGKMDWDMAAWAYYNGMDIKIFPKAIIYHDHHEGKTDTDHNTEVFNRRVKEMHENSI